MERCWPEVALVVDGEFGERLEAIAARCVVWIADSATNRAVVERLRRVGAPYELTLFRYNPLESGPEAFAAIISVVDEHHGVASCDPRYQRLAVYGARPNAIARAALVGIGFELEAATSDGFIARALGAA